MKILLYTLFVSLLLTACERPQPAGAASNEKIVRQYFDLFNRHDWSAMAAMYTDTANFKDPSLGSGVVKQTRQQTIDKYTQLNEAFPDVHDEIVALYPSGERHIVVEFVSTGTAPDGSAFTLPICTIFTLEGGLIAGDYTYYDNFGEQP
ncbi:MAG: nuclear transport factor 2 family protein [Cyclobacteriaceae bacterium]|nr:nuclear transport factor 2 family protein [Cyclobacteriaceae bacterium]